MHARNAAASLVALLEVKPQLKRLISRARRLEALSMSTYVKLANGFRDRPELHEFWMSMARHEASHVGALELLEVMIEQASEQLPLPAARAGAPGASEVIDRLHREADGAVSVERAFEIAVELESVEVEDLVFELFGMVADPGQRDHAEQMLVHDLSDLSLMIEKYTRDDALLAKADALVERHVGRRERRRTGTR